MFSDTFLSFKKKKRKEGERSKELRKVFLKRSPIDVASQVALVDVLQPVQEEVLPWKKGVRTHLETC